MPVYLAIAFLLFALSASAQTHFSTAPGNRLTHLNSNDPFYVGLHFPKLTTPQWIGEPDVEVVVTLGIDDMGANHNPYEAFLRPILERLKQIDGRAPVSIFSTAIAPDAGHLKTWLAEGLSLEVHTLHHPCPILGRNGFEAAQNTFHGGVDLLSHVPGNKPVAFRTPCCDSINSPSPRLFAEIFNRTNAAGQFLTMDSSVMNIITAKDPGLPSDWLLDADGKEKFRKYVPFPSFVTTIENYPYPYVIGNLCWEFSPTAPSDWEAQHLHGPNNPKTVADWKTALDCIVQKQGVFNIVFHPHNWIRPEQVIEFIDYSVQRYGKRVKFLTFREAQDRINKHLLPENPMRRTDGQDNGVRLADINNDGFMDVIIANETTRLTRIWNADEKRWDESSFPVALVQRTAHETGVRFGILQTNGNASFIIRNETISGAWHFDGTNWIEEKNFFTGLELKGVPLLSSRAGQDTGVRMRDIDGDGLCEIIVGSAEASAVFSRKAHESTWRTLDFSLPPHTSIVNTKGEDDGLRFVDLNSDGYDDVVFSNEERFSVHLFVPAKQLGWKVGWTRQTIAGKRGDPGEIPPIVRYGVFRNNGAWFHSRHLWVQNETTSQLPNLVDRRSFDELLNGHSPLPLEPDAALGTFELSGDFTIELVAAEPLVRDPIAFEWGPDGKLWVVEMGDYPRGLDDKGKSGGVVRFLEDTDKDGRYDKSTEFLSGLNFPNGVKPWHNGVLISAAPEIIYAEDTNGDGKADLQKTLFSGFVEGNQQHRVNGFSYGLDGWLYVANGDSGGEILSAATGKKVSIAHRDFRISPDLTLLETEPGQTQFGRHRDDWGNWFGNNNSTWLWHYFLPDRYLARNPHVAAANTRQLLANYTDATRVFPSSRAMPRPNQVGAANHVTSANSATPYRDELLGAEFTHSVFISEPVHNMVHREVLQPTGITFRSQRAATELNREFLRSTDNWFRPTMLKTGPDGALYIADMYRLVIEHPEYMPQDMIEKSDLRAGNDRGRIYRVYPKGAKLRSIPNLQALDTSDLVTALDSSNGWQRDTAQQLLIERGDRSAVSKLASLFQTSQRPQARLHALYTLSGLNALAADHVIAPLQDSHSGVREHAIRLSEPFLQRQNDAVLQALLPLVGDKESRVRYQLAFTLGESKDPRAGQALARLATNYSTDQQLEVAILSSALPHLSTLLRELLASPGHSSRIAERLASMAGASSDQSIHSQTISALTSDPGNPIKTSTLQAFASFIEAYEKQNRRHGNLEREIEASLISFSLMLRDELTEDSSSEIAENRISVAMRLLARRAHPANNALFMQFLAPRFPQPLQRQALASLLAQPDAEVPEKLINLWQTAVPSMRSEILSALISRVDWTKTLLHSLQSGHIPVGQINATERQKLLNHSQEEIRQQATSLFGGTSDRKEVIEKYKSVSNLPGNAERGRAIFVASCAACHRLAGDGNAVGPDLAMVAGKPLDWLLTAILDPNQMVDGSFVAYTVQTKDDREINGLIAEENPTSITFKTPTGSSETVLRSDIVQLSASGLSLMPDGLEANISLEQMADLIAFLNSNGPPRKHFPNNEPKVVQMDSQQQLRLTPTFAGIYGDSLVIEPRYGNLGWWTSENDRATWSVQISESGLFDVWFDWSLDGGGGQNNLLLEIAGGKSMSAAIPGTGSWDLYKQAKFGSIEIPAGSHRVTLRAAPPLQGAVMDLRELRLVPKNRVPQFSAQSANTAPVRKQVPGNHPRLVQPQPNGKIVLSASDCEIYGNQIAVYEPQRCLGWWTSEADQVIWKFNLPASGDYDVLLEWSITDEWANNKFVITCDDAQLNGSIPSTGGFEHYRVEKFGSIKIATGERTLLMRPAGPVKGELADLRAITLVPIKK